MRIPRPARALALAALAALLVAAGAEANVPDRRDRVKAKRIARQFWEQGKGEVVPCAGVRLRWIVRGRRLRFTRNDLAAVADGGCTIYFNRRVRWGWWRLCAVTIHEYGHVIGYRHSRNPRSIMYPTLFEAAWYPRFRACRRSG